MLLQAWLVDIGLRSVSSEIATMIAMTALALPPIVTNTYVGVSEVDGDLVEAARGMGMTARQVLRRVELPVALPVILAGIRTAAVQVVATATLGAVFATGGLGRYIIDGIAQRRYDEVLAGAVLVGALSILTEVGFTLVERRTAPGRRASGAARHARCKGPSTSPVEPNGNDGRITHVPGRLDRRALGRLPRRRMTPADHESNRKEKPNADEPQACPRGGGAGARRERLLVG